MSKKILAVDLDDTLLSDDKTISEDNIAALNQMLDEGHVLAVDTGRPAHVIAKLLSPYPVFSRKNVYFLGFQGSLGYDPYNDEYLFGTFLDNAAAIDLLEKIHDSGLSALAFENGKIYAYEIDDNIVGYNKASGEHIDIMASAQDLKGRNLSKLMAVDFANHKALHDFVEANEKITDVHFNNMFSNVAFLEYVSKTASKGDGLVKLAEYLKVPVEDTIAVGDERNDISMIEAAGVGVSVINGRDEAKAVANYVTTVNNNNGAVAEVINKFILNQ